LTVTKEYTDSYLFAKMSKEPIHGERHVSALFSEGVCGMKINDIQRTAPIQAYQKIGAQVPREERRRGNRQDQIEISNEAKRLAEQSTSGTTVQDTSNIPAGNTERIETIRQAIQAGTYRVDSRQVAEKFVDFWFGRR
jgi:negative regulator of flagellin synthesis FlgM